MSGRAPRRVRASTGRRSSQAALAGPSTLAVRTRRRGRGAGTVLMPPGAGRRSRLLVQQGAHRAGGGEPGAAGGQVIETRPRQWARERARDVLEVDERDELGLLGVARYLRERQDDDLDAGPGELLERFQEVAAVTAGDADAVEAAGRRPPGDVLDHGVVDVVLGAELRPREHAVAERADRL